MIENYIDTILLPHNQEAFEKVMGHFSSNQRAAVVHATGTGKSFIIAAVTQHFNKVVVIAPNNFVLDETRKLCGGNVTFRTYASVMCDDYPVSGYDLIVLDEFHRAGADKWGEGVARLIAANPGAKLLGTSATAIRYLDGKRNMADELFDGNVVSSLPLRDAIDRGIIPEPTYVASLYAFTETYLAVKNQIMASNKKTEEEKMKAMRTLSGIAHNWKNAQGVGVIMRKYLDRDIKRIIVFCSSVKRAAKVRRFFKSWLASAGFRRMRFYNIDYTEKHLEKEMADFQRDNFDGIKVAISVNMLNEGVHIPNVDAVVMMRSTVSPNIILQQIGRCLTAKKTGRKPVVIDLVNNMDTLGQTCGWQLSETRAATGVKDDDPSLDKGFPFHVIDECRDIRTFLTQIQNEFEVVSDFYPKFWEFVGLHGRLPKNSVKGEYPLYVWCGQVWNNKYGMADKFPDVFNKLKEMRWGECKKIHNEIMYSSFWEFVNIYGRLPKRSIKEEKPLYNWCSSIGINKNRMAERYLDVLDKMKKLGYISKEDKMIERVSEYRSFINEYGRLPRKSVKEESSLYAWCLDVKNNKYGLGDRLPEIREEIVSMGMVSTDEKTKKSVESLRLFIENNDRLPKFSLKEERSMWSLCQRIKLNDRGIAERFSDMVTLLNKYEWKSPSGKMDLAIEKFWNFYKRTGRLPMPNVQDEKSLHIWCLRITKNKDEMRVKYPQLSDVLDLIGDTFCNKEDTEKENYKELYDYLVKNNRLPSMSFDRNVKMVSLYKRIVSNKNNLKEKYPDVYNKILELGYKPAGFNIKLNMEELMIFLEKNNRLPSSDTEEEKSLHNLCGRLGSNSNGLADRFPDVYTKIKEMGWGNVKLTKRYNEFWEFFNKNKRLPMSGVEEEESLYDWCVQVAGNKRGLAEKYPDVAAILKEQRWGESLSIAIEGKIAELKKFIKENGRLPQKGVKEDKKLYALCARIHINKGGLADKFPQMNAILDDMGWGNALNLKTEKRRTEFWEFVGLHGRLPKSNIKEEMALYGWCNDVYRNKNGLAERFPEVYAKIKELKEKK